ncbi:MAG: DUF4349 domain-containing protein [Chitinophagaceae bacterium]|nr:DUF4349 domain-containing protein [Chitinophagaceae bacterium]
MKTIYSFLFLTSILLFFSCNQTYKSDSTPKSADMSLSAPVEQNKASDKELPKNLASDTSGGIFLQGSAPNSNPDWDKKIIKTAVLKLEVKNFKIYSDIVHKAAKQYGGYIANEEQDQSAEKKEATISIKVPVEQFESLLNQLPSDTDKIVEKKITSEDVTGEVVDTKSRLEAKAQTRLKYLEFLKQAKNMEDVLKVQEEINDIQEEIESASGRINYLSHQSAFSTINLTFYQPLPGFVPDNNTPGFLQRTVDAFKTGINFIGEIVIGLVSVWPLWLLIFGGRILWRKRAFAKLRIFQK